MGFRVAGKALHQREAIRVDPVHPGQRGDHGAVLVVPGRDRKNRLLIGKKSEGRGPLPSEALLRVDGGPGRVVHHPELRLVEVGHFLQVLQDLEQVVAVALLQLFRLDLQVLVGIGRTVDSRLDQKAQAPHPQKVGDEPVPLSVPGEEDGTGRALPVQLRELQGLPGAHLHLRLQHAAGPDEADEIHQLPASQPEQQGPRLLGEVAVPDSRLPALEIGAGVDLHLGPRPGPVGMEPLEIDPEPGIQVAALVAQDRRPFAVARQHQVGVPIRVQVRRDRSPPLGGRHLVEPRRGGGVGEAALPVVPQEPEPLPRDEKVQVAVVVVIEGRGSQGPRFRADSLPGLEPLPLTVPEPPACREKEVGPPVAVQIREGRTVPQPVLRETRLLPQDGIGADPVVAEDHLRARGRGDDEVHVPVVVQIAEGHGDGGEGAVRAASPRPSPGKSRCRC